MIKVTKIKELGTAQTMEEALMYKNYLKNDLEYNIDSSSFNFTKDPEDPTKEIVEFNISYKTDKTIDILGM